MSKRVLLVANSASMIDHFNRDNISILKNMGYDITVAANFREGNSSTNERIAEFEKELSDNNIDVIDLPIPRKVSQLDNIFKSIKKLKKYMSENPCELIHTQTPFGGVIGRLAAKKYRKKGTTKVIYFVHGFHFFKGASKKNFIIYYNIEKYLAKYTDCLITLNHEDYEAANKFSSQTVEYVPGVGIDTNSIYNITTDISNKRKTLGIPDNSRIILTVAELIPRKNLETSIRAFAKIKTQNCVLLICGKGALLDSLKTLCTELGIDKKVIFAGYRTDILEIYKIADLFIFTSYQEGLSVAVMQAMASGLPIVASNIRGNTDLLENQTNESNFNALVEPDNIDDFTTKIDYLLNNKELCNTIGKLNYEACCNSFDIRIVHEQMSNIYNNLLKN